MAFHQTTRQLQQRVVRADSNASEPRALAPQVRARPDESQTWVLFSPVTDTATTTTSTSYLSSVQHVQTTPGRSRISDLGSLETIARSEFDSQARNSEAFNAVDDSVAEEDAELDSLDSHLAEFRSTHNPYGQQGISQTAPVLPAHDGLGSFRLDRQGMSAEVQDQLFAFERFNPRRVKRRRESLELAPLDFETEHAEQELDRNRRIEAWRLEQSQLLLEEVQRETRRRRQSEASRQKKVQSTNAAAEEALPTETLGDPARDVVFNGSEWHDQDASDLGSSHEKGLWSRITRKVIRDLMGIDDRLLSILFGEALPDDDELSSTPKASIMNGVDAASDSWHDSTWQLHMLERIARELGMLVHKMANHPGAFSTYQRVQQMSLPYAGLPVIPEGGLDIPDPYENEIEASVPSMPQFRPTAAQAVDIPGARSSESLAAREVDSLMASQASAVQTFTQDEWEQDLDIKLVFRYLRSRFTSSSSSPLSPFASGTGTSHLATSSTQDAAAKAARVRQHHPLVSPHAIAAQRTARPTAERRVFKPATASTVGASSPAVLRHHHHRHRSGSCASQSTRRSARLSSVSSRHSSRHYWDVGGSIGTGSMIASAGSMGSWGEV